MQYTLMHKRIKTAEIELDDDAGFIRKTGAVYAPEHLPLGIPLRAGRIDRMALNEWWTDRSIPVSRSGVRRALQTLELDSTLLLPPRCFGLNLSDQYWICPEGSGLMWEDVNFFEHDFSEDVGDVLFGADKKAETLDFSSPDNTLDGNLKKRWKIMGRERCLVKGGSGPFCQQPFNEVIAAGIMERLGIPHVPYSVIWDEGEPYSVCGDFVTKDTELVPAWRIYQTQKKSNNVSVYQHFVNCCESLGIEGAVPFLDRMIALDYLIANEDRHMNNFGVLRDAETLRWIGFAPIYDSGSSLGYDKTPAQIRLEQGVVCKPFKNHHAEQLKLASDFEWIDFDALRDVREYIAGILSADCAEAYIDQNRIRAVAEAVQRRIANLSKFAVSRTPQAATTEDDVAKNIAEDYV